MAGSGKAPRSPVLAEAVIDSLSHDGRGVARVDGKATFVLGALPGERVRLRVVKRHRNFDEAEADAVIEASPRRVVPVCDAFGRCGGCTLQHLAAEAQIASKERVLLDALRHIGQLEPEVVYSPLVGPSWGYRRKARLGVKHVAKKGRVLVGFRERGSGFITEAAACPVLHPRVGGLLRPLGDLIAGLSRPECVPQVEVAMGDEDCVLAFRFLAPPTTGDLDALAAFGQRHGVVAYVQEGGLDTLRPAVPPGVTLTYALPDFDVAFEFRPGDFTQVNFELNRLMVGRALALLAPQPHERVLDLFCGLGNFTLPLARRATRVVGVEGEAGLITRAQANAERNRITNVRFVAGDLYRGLDAAPWVREGPFDCALLDPPRTGALEVLEHLPALGIGRILYVSCYPGTLARDAAELTRRHGYRLAGAGAMDMFPHTAHVESMALFVTDR